VAVADHDYYAFDRPIWLQHYYRGRPVGSSGEVGVFSFYATKLMTTGEGGMRLANDARILSTRTQFFV